jgi:hypothetical protein
MQTPDLDTVLQLAEQLSREEQVELLRRLEARLTPHQLPSQTLRVFHVDAWPEGLTLRREDEYGDDAR